MSEATVRILRILLQCGMIAREEQEIVRSLIRGSMVPDSLASDSSASRGGARADSARADSARADAAQENLQFDFTRPGPGARACGLRARER
jgi:hypothetical protein